MQAYEFCGKKLLGVPEEAGRRDWLDCGFPSFWSDPSCSWLAGWRSQAAKTKVETSKAKQNFFMSGKENASSLTAIGLRVNVQNK
jgi:hypothetical protein